MKSGARELLQTITTDARKLRDELVAGLRDMVHQEPIAHIAVVVGAIAVGVFLRLHFLFQPLRADEAFTYVRYSSQSPLRIMAAYTTPNNHILHSILVSLSTHLFGSEPWALRLPALAAGVLVIPLSYLACRTYFGRAPAAISAALVACSSVLVEFSTNARGYSIMTACFLVAMIAAHRIAVRGETQYFALLTATVVAGLFTVPVMLYGVCFIVVWLTTEIFVRRRRGAGRADVYKRLAVAIAASLALTAALYFPAVLYVGVRRVVANPIVAPRADFAELLIASLPAIWAQWHEGWGLAMAAVVSAGFILAVVKHRIVAAHCVPLPVGLIGCLVLVMIQRVSPYRRVWMFLAPVYLAIAAAGLADALRRVAGRNTKLWVYLCSAAAVTLGALGAYGVLTTRTPYYSLETGTARDAERVTMFLKSRLRDSDLIIADLQSESVLQYFFQKHRIPGQYFLQRNRNVQRVFVVFTAAGVSDPEVLQSAKWTWQLVAEVLDADDMHRGVEIFRSADAVVQLCPVRPNGQGT